jgi:hypothetical protein
MEKLFANLYRFSAIANKSRNIRSHSYLLLRKEGNLMICHTKSGPPAEEFDQIEALGGVSSQWVSHHHDIVAGSFHEDLHARFGCELYYHKADRAGVRGKTKCQSVQFEDDGLGYASDFEALYLPTCSVGHSVYRWRCRGKYYLFTSHALSMKKNKWDLHFNPRRVDLWRPHLPGIARLHVDYVFPGYTEEDEDGDYYTLSDQNRKSLAKAFKAEAATAA